ncbi:MAG TPA: TIGR03084 family metal-binding protein [Marmoricola sp.]|nr:TIGR03084 family metal-binding protein [Marmoricola sp.]
MTDPRLRAVLDDLALEGDWLDGLVTGLDEDGWRTATPAEGWDVATSIAHLAWTDEVAAVAATDKAGWDAVVLRALDDPGALVDGEALAGGAVPPTQLLARWRASRARLSDALAAHDPATKLPWFGPPMSPTSMATARYMETWAHGLDIAEGLGVAVEPHDRVRHVVHIGVRTRGFSFASNGLPAPTEEVRVELRAPSGELWEYGDEGAAQRVTGQAWDFALLVTQRRHRSDLAVTAEGEEADRWLDVAQAFAGPSGGGREPAG